MGDNYSGFLDYRHHSLFPLDGTGCTNPCGNSAFSGDRHASISCFQTDYYVDDENLESKQASGIYRASKVRRFLCCNHNIGITECTAGIRDHAVCDLFVDRRSTYRVSTDGFVGVALSVWYRPFSWTACCSFVSCQRQRYAPDTNFSDGLLTGCGSIHSCTQLSFCVPASLLILIRLLLNRMCP